MSIDSEFTSKLRYPYLSRIIENQGKKYKNGQTIHIYGNN